MRIESVRVEIHRQKERFQHDELELFVSLEPGDEWHVMEARLRAEMLTQLRIDWAAEDDRLDAEREAARARRQAEQEAERAAARALRDAHVEGCLAAVECPCHSCPTECCEDCPCPEEHRANADNDDDRPF